MSLEFTKLSAAPVAEELSDSATVLVEDGGEVKRVAKDSVGGGSAELPKPIPYDYMPEGYPKDLGSVYFEYEVNESNPDSVNTSLYPKYRYGGDDEYFWHDYYLLSACPITAAEFEELRLYDEEGTSLEVEERTTNSAIFVFQGTEDKLYIKALFAPGEDNSGDEMPQGIYLDDHNDWNDFDGGSYSSCKSKFFTFDFEAVEKMADRFLPMSTIDKEMRSILGEDRYKNVFKIHIRNEAGVISSNIDGYTIDEFSGYLNSDKALYVGYSLYDSNGIATGDYYYLYPEKKDTTQNSYGQTLERWTFRSLDGAVVLTYTAKTPFSTADGGEWALVTE